MVDVKAPASVAPGVQLPEGARIRGRAQITNANQVLVMGPSRFDQVTMCTAHLDPDIGVRFVRGCFSGTAAGFRAAAQDYARGRPDQIVQTYEYIEAAAAHFKVNL